MPRHDRSEKQRHRRWVATIAIALPALFTIACGPIVFEGSGGNNLFEGAAPEPEMASEPPRVEVTDDAIVIHEKIQFDFNKATIRKESDDLLAEIAKVINENQQIKLIRIEGHASNEGSDAYNLDLSERRAGSVRKHLTKKGKVDKDRLVSKGYGESQPIESNDTETGREANRRVEFIILEQEVTEVTKTTDPDTGEVTESKTTKLVKKGDR